MQPNPNLPLSLSLRIKLCVVPVSLSLVYDQRKNEKDWNDGKPEEERETKGTKGKDSEEVRKSNGLPKQGRSLRYGTEPDF